MTRPAWLKRWGKWLAYLLGVSGTAGTAVSSVGFTNLEAPWRGFPWVHFWPAGLLELSLFATATGGFIGVREIQTADQLRDGLDSCRGTLQQREGHIRELLDQISLDRKDFRDRVRQYLATIAEDLGLGATERVTLYKHDGAAFATLVRYSPNPEFDKRGRPIYPDDEGLIGKAWREGEAFAQDLPDGQADLQAYRDELQTRGIPLPMLTLQGLRMKPRCLAGFSLRDPKNINPLAVLVFESRQPRGLRRPVLRELVAGPHGLRLREYLNDSRAIVPTPSRALAAAL